MKKNGVFLDNLYKKRNYTHRGTYEGTLRFVTRFQKRLKFVQTRVED